MTRAEIDRALLALRQRKMAQSAFAHFRGTGEDFHRRTLPELLRLKAPAVWLNGDLHLENFGTYRGDNRLTYFDIGDFDDACLGPAVIDLARFLGGIMVAAPEMGLSFAEARGEARQALMRYRAALVDGKARWIERRVASGAIGDLLRELEGRSQIDLLAKRTVLKNGKRRLRFDTGKALKLEKAEAARVVAALDRFARDRAAPGFFRVLDVAQRVAGLGALGRARYVVLVAGNSKNGGGRHGPALIDLKLQPGSILAPLLVTRRQRQPDFANEARRVVEIEYRLQAAAPAFLTELAIGRRPFTFRELQPDQDKLEARHLAGDPARRREALGTMAELIAWAQLRTGGWRGSATIDQLMAWGGNRDWPAPLLALATRAAKSAIQAWAGAQPATN
ncbi:uncharacterized protein (DUF2252 family) [Dongia mobilis]|uniref:Uncharacterized protein (DUF2252 family) n=1 Tax=Dongia mobilis TaxID=578943 RepID=A0A4R6WR61_9PROT|nr:DUF2252 family protein [Dongia mobilis]TDQ82007.1 uncharacterized protein (DUF2252 family) [Dongia mobilis]